MTQSAVATVTMKYVHWLDPCISREDFRPNLMGFLIEPRAEGCLLVATDGVVLMAIHDKAATAKRALIWQPSKMLTAASAGADSNQTITLDSELWGEEAKGEYPNWRKAVPNGAPPLEPPIYSIEKLSRFRNVGSPDPLGPLSIVVTGGIAEGGRNPGIVGAPDYPEFFGLVMPIQNRSEYKKALTPPEWISATP